MSSLIGCLVIAYVVYNEVTKLYPTLNIAAYIKSKIAELFGSSTTVSK